MASADVMLSFHCGTMLSYAKEFTVDFLPYFFPFFPFHFLKDSTTLATQSLNNALITLISQVNTSRSHLTQVLHVSSHILYLLTSYICLLQIPPPPHIPHPPIPLPPLLPIPGRISWENMKYGYPIHLTILLF